MKREDLRQPDELRKITIQRKFIKYAEGSCLITVGNTKVVVTATVEDRVPQFLKGKGEGWLTAEYGMLPRSTQSRILRDRISGRNMEIQRLIGRSLRSVVNLKTLGEKTIRIDCDVIQADGGTRIASVIGGFIALVDCLEKMRNDALIVTLPITSFLGAISVGIVGKTHLLDLTYSEDCRALVDMNVVMKAGGEFVEIQGTGEGSSFSKSDLDQMLTLAKKGIEDIIDLERTILKDSLGDL